MEESYILKLNSYHENLSKTFSRLRSKNDYSDVTFVTDDQKLISAHKVVLSASSEYFEEILSLTKDLSPTPILCIKGINSVDLVSVLDYIYLGEVQITQERLEHFLQTGIKLKISGLYETSNFGNDAKPNSVAKEIMEKEEEKTLAEVKEPNLTVQVNNGDFNNVEELDQKIFENMIQSEGGHQCLICNKVTSKKSHLKEHVETHFEGLSFECQLCGKSYKNRPSLRDHTKTHNKNRKMAGFNWLKK